MTLAFLIRRAQVHRFRERGKFRAQHRGRTLENYLPALARTHAISGGFGNQPTDRVAQTSAAADRELHLDAEWNFDVVPRGMEHAGGHSAMDG